MMLVLLCATRAVETACSDQWSINRLPGNSRSGTITAYSSLPTLDAVSIKAKWKNHTQELPLAHLSGGK
ncbi:MAG: hypothetical protein HQK60_13865 [Deltaproteobacteria bacterium]|nr:hypothetical protein [Deltaproteobacteria bacterium]